MVSLRKTMEKRRRMAASAVGVILVLSVTLFVVGLVFIANKECSDDLETAVTASSTQDLCTHSAEAVKSGFINLLANVRRTYALLRLLSNNPAPSRSYLDPDIIKDTTDEIKRLLKDFNSLHINTSTLQPRELRAVAELQQFLEHNFAENDDYYTGIWMLGPNVMCTDYICRSFKSHVSWTGSVRFRPKSVQDFLKIRDALSYHNRTVHQYIENIQYGVQSGMVRSKEACLAGFNAVKARYLKIAELNATGILQESFVLQMLRSDYFINLNNTEKETWRKTYGKTVSESMEEFLVEYLGKSLEKLLRFLEYENMLHCVPSSVSSGLANLPVPYVYFNGTKTKKRTKPFLPTGEKLNGKMAYEKSLAFYTTTNLTADEVYNLGWKHVNKLYIQILELARNITGQKNESKVKEDFITLLTDRKQFYNEQPFPQNESFAEASKNCLNTENAKKFCPKRWQALQVWFDEEAKLLSKMEPKLTSLFHFVGSKRTTPNCPIQLVPAFLPSMAAASYNNKASCRQPAVFRLPFFNDNYGPRYQSISINAHEGRPGHHTQRQGYPENFKSGCQSDVLSWVDRKTSYSAFTEGWGLYAEYPLVAEYTDVYMDQALSRYGMLKGQMMRALRLVVDSGLHYKGMKRDEAISLFDKYMWDTSDVTMKEITRYQSVPAQASSYKIGQLTFINLKNYAEKQLGKNFNFRDFHYELLRHGSVPLDYIKYHVKKYIACEINKESADCKYVWNARSATMRDSEDVLSEEKLLPMYDGVNSEIFY